MELKGGHNGKKKIKKRVYRRERRRDNLGGDMVRAGLELVVLSAGLGADKELKKARRNLKRNEKINNKLKNGN